MPTPRRKEFTRARSRSLTSPIAPLLQVACGVNGRLGLATSTVLTVTSDMIAYGRYEIPIDQIERAVRTILAFPAPAFLLSFAKAIVCARMSMFI